MLLNFDWSIDKYRVVLCEYICVCLCICLVDVKEHFETLKKHYRHGQWNKLKLINILELKT